MTRAIALSALLLSGCVSMKAVSNQTSSQARFDPATRPQAWSRALVAFQLHAALISASDPAGGIIRTEVQPGWVECHGIVATRPGANRGQTEEVPRACRTSEHSQLTLGTDGTAFLLVNRVVYGLTEEKVSPLTPADSALLQKASDQFLAFIVGTSTKTPEPPPPAPAGLPSI